VHSLDVVLVFSTSFFGYIYIWRIIDKKCCVDWLYHFQYLL